MIDENKLIRDLEAYCGKQRYLVLENIWEIINNQPKISEWIPCSQKMPENEQEVEITYVRERYLTGEVLYMTARAFYEDGTLTVDESAYDWAENEYYEYFEETDSYMVPKGWYEDVSFAEEFAPIHNAVIAWRAIGKPYHPLSEE